MPDSHPPHSQILTEEKTAVYVHGVTKQFNKGNVCIQALREVDFDTRVGELLIIAGPSGSGKTTLLSIIAGTLSPDSGEVNVFDYAIEKMNEKEKTLFRKKNVGFIFQHFHLIPTLTVLENVSIPLLVNGMSGRAAHEKAAHFLEKVGLKGREYESPQSLSGGQQQRVAIARALVHEPKLIICDEPTSAIDAETGKKIMELIVNMAKLPNRCGIIVTHDNRIFKYADRVVLMDDGNVINNEDC